MAPYLVYQLMRELEPGSVILMAKIVENKQTISPLRQLAKESVLWCISFKFTFHI